MASRAKSPRRPPGLSHPPFDAVADPRKHSIFIEDFVADTDRGGQLVLSDVAGTGSLSAVTTASIVQENPGVVSVTSGAIAANESTLAPTGNMDAYILPDGSTDLLYAGARIQLPSIASVEVYFGLFDSASAAGRGANAVALEFDASVASYWQPFVADGSSVTASTVATADQVDVAASTWYNLEILAHEDECQFFVNGQYIGSETGANIPDDEGLNWVVKVATETSAAKSVYVDWVAVRKAVDRVEHV